MIIVISDFPFTSKIIVLFEDAELYILNVRCAVFSGDGFPGLAIKT